MTCGVFVTGTDTGVGKTWIAVGLLEALRRQRRRAAGLKPVACGAAVMDGRLHNEDVRRLMHHATVPLAYDEACRYTFAPPVAPQLAAAHAGRTIEIAEMRALYERAARRAECVVVEGIGGWYVPLSERSTVADLARALALPVVLVVGIRLGCLNHALLTGEAIARSGAACAGWIANCIDPACRGIEENINALRARLAAPLLGVVPHLTRLDASLIADHLRVGRLFPPGA